MATSTQPVKTVPAPKQMISPSNVNITKNVPPPPTESQKAAQDWINNPKSGQGGMDLYTKVQNDRWQTANKNKDYDLMKRLQSDSQGVGYTLNPYNPPAPNTSAPKEFADWQAKQGELMQKFETMLNNPVQFNPETDPRYQAFRQLSQKRAGDASRAAMETMNDRGLLNSSITASQLGQIQQGAEQEALAAIPQFYAEARQDYQDRLRNAAEMLRFAAGRGDVAADLDYRNQRAARSDMESDRTFDRSVLESNRNFDRGAFENDRAYEYQVGRDQVGDQRYAQEFEYQQARDQIKDEQYKQQFDEDVRRFGLDYALRAAAQANQFANAAADNARANASLGLQRERFEFDKQQANSKGSTGTRNSYKENPEYSQELQYIYSNPKNAINEIQDNVQALIEAYGNDGYNDLLKEAQRVQKASSEG